MENLTSVYRKAFRDLLKLVDMCAQFNIDETNVLGHARIEQLCQENFSMSYREVLKKIYCDEEIIDMDHLKFKKWIKG